MDLHQVMHEFQRTIDFIKEPFFEYMRYEYDDNEKIKTIYYSFLKMCKFQSLYMSMINNENPYEVIQKQIATHPNTWKKIIDF